MNLFYFILQLRSDIAELKSLMASAKSDRVKNALTIELRRWETKLADMLENEKKSVETEPSVPSKTTDQPSRSYDVHLKNYCKY